MSSRTIGFDGEDVVVIDQTRLPDRLEMARWRTLADAASGITEMQVRGAPLIGVAAAHALALALAAAPHDLDGPVARLLDTRPTAVNLRWALETARQHLEPLPIGERLAAARALATQMADDDAAACRRIGEHGVVLLETIHRRMSRPVRILTHCNAGRLACVEWGTATAPIYLAHEHQIPLEVWVSETRPRNQGAALTAWELAEAGIDHTLVVDDAAAHLMAIGLVDIVITGADRIARNGDTANKIGTALKALAARHHGIDMVVAAPRSTFDATAADGSTIPIEERDPAEILDRAGAPAGTTARNWGFDVTPAALITTFITEDGLVDPADVADWLTTSAPMSSPLSTPDPTPISRAMP